MKFAEIYNDWNFHHPEGTKLEAFTAGINARETDDPRDVLIARLSVDNERLHQRLKELYDANHKAKDALSNALSSLDHQWHPY